MSSTNVQAKTQATQCQINMATKDKDKLTSIKCVTNPQRNTPDKSVAMTMLSWQKNCTSDHESSNKILKCNKNFWGIYAKITTIGDKVIS